MVRALSATVAVGLLFLSVRNVSLCSVNVCYSFALFVCVIRFGNVFIVSGLCVVVCRCHYTCP